MNHITKRYNIGISIINNNQGVKTMINKIKAYIWYYSKSIYALIYNKINSMLEKIGYFFVGYKVDIEQNQDDIKAIREYKIGLHKFKTLTNDIKAVEICINLAKSEHESLKNLHNNLALDVSDMNTRLLKLEDFETRTLKEIAQDVLSEKEEYESQFVVNDERANIMGLGNRLSQTLINDKKKREEINNLVNALDEAFNYGSYSNKNDIKEIVSNHIGNKLVDDDINAINNNNKVNNCVDEIAKVVYFDYNNNDKQAIKDVIVKHINLNN